MITRPQTIRRRLLGDQVLLILLLSGTLLATTFLGARRAVEGLSGEIIERATDQAEAELHRFFDPVAAALLALRSWSESGIAGDGDPEAFRQLILPVVERLPQISGVIRADESGHEFFLLPIDGTWRLRVTRKGAPGPIANLTTEWLEPESAPASLEARPEVRDYDPRTRPWFTGALAQPQPGSIYWTEPYVFVTASQRSSLAPRSIATFATTGAGL